MREELKIKIPNYRADIDGLRAIAVLLVIVFHVFPKSLKGGFVGVDIFFVISGYLITGIILNGLENQSFSFSNFFVKRIKRIFPVLLIVIACVFIAGWFLLFPKELMELAKHITGGVTYVANFTLWSESGYFDSAPELKPLLHLWSLSIEEQFYLLWPVLLFFITKYRLKFMPFFLAGITASFVLNMLFISRYADAVFYFPFTRFWELLIGGLLALVVIQKHKINEKYSNVLSTIGFIFIFLAASKFSSASSFPSWRALLPTMGATFIIFAGEKAWLNSKILSHRLVVWIGLISYPLYLWHWPIFSFMSISVGKLPHHLDQILVVIFSFLLSWLSYKYIETPIRHSKNTKRITMVLLLISLVLGIAGFSVYQMHGVPSRFSQKSISVKLVKDMLQPGYGGYIGKDWREHHCFLARGENFNLFETKCFEDKTKPLVFLWGDSHAAALYSGLLSLQARQKIGIAQYTASLCPPILNWSGSSNKFCREINDHVFSIVKNTKPDIVILEAAWNFAEYDWKAVGVTIKELRKIGISKIILFGASPLWKEKVPNNIISYYRKYNHLPPKYTDFGLEAKNEQVKMDNQLYDLAIKSGGSFFSIFKKLCNENGCMLLSGDQYQATSLDQGHLSKSAAEFVFQSADLGIL